MRVEQIPFPRIAAHLIVGSLAFQLCSAQSKSRQPQNKAEAVRVIELPQSVALPIRIAEPQPLPTISVRIVEDQKPWLKPEVIVAGCAVAISLLALGATIWQGIIQRRGTQLQMFENAFRDIRETELAFKQRYEIPLEMAIREMQEAGRMPGSVQEFNEFVQSFEKERYVTAFAFFQTVEFMALLINSRIIREPKIRSYFDPAVPFWYEEMLVKHCKDWAEDGKMFPEFKVLHARLKRVVHVPAQA